MKADTRMFGAIEIEDSKIIRLEQGIIGFPDMKNFALIFDADKGEESSSIKWLQSMDDEVFAMPVISPYDLVPDYAPSVSDEVCQMLGGLNKDNCFILVTVTVPREIEKISINLKAPVLINTDNNRGIQLILEQDYPIKYKIYDLIKKEGRKEGDSECSH